MTNTSSSLSVSLSLNDSLIESSSLLVIIRGIVLSLHALRGLRAGEGGGEGRIGSGGGGESGIGSSPGSGPCTGGGRGGHVNSKGSPGHGCGCIRRPHSWSRISAACCAFTGMGMDPSLCGAVALFLLPCAHAASNMRRYLTLSMSFFPGAMAVSFWGNSNLFPTSNKSKRCPRPTPLIILPPREHLIVTARTSSRI